MYAKKTIIAALATTLIATGAGASGAIDAGLNAAYSLVGGAEVDASGAHDLLLDSEAKARAEANGLVDAANVNACGEIQQAYATSLPTDDLTNRMDVSESHAKHLEHSQEVDTGLVRAKAWGIGDAQANSHLNGVADQLPEKPAQPDLPCSYQAQADIPEVDAEVPTKFSHEESLGAEHAAAADAAMDAAGEVEGIVETP